MLYLPLYIFHKYIELGNWVFLINQQVDYLLIHLEVSLLIYGLLNLNPVHQLL